MYTPLRKWGRGLGALAAILAVFVGAGCARGRPRLAQNANDKPRASELHALPIAPDVDYVQALNLGGNRRLYHSEHDLLYAEDDHFFPIVVQGFPRLVGPSPNGRAVAFLEPVEFEMAADLFVFDVPARSLRRITRHHDGDSTRSVKAARWSDARTLYYLEGFRFGTVSRGGDLWRVDVSSLERRPVVEVMGRSEKLEEIVEFEFVPGGAMIRYVVARYDDSGIEARTPHYCTLEGKEVK